MINISKKRDWDKCTRPDGSTFYDFYNIYDMNKNQLGKYLNTWFRSGLSSHTNGVIYFDSLTTLKKVDKDSVWKLYMKKYNPVSIFISVDHTSVNQYLEQLKINEKQSKPNKKKSLIKNLPPVFYQMKCTLRSVDDSSYSIWWDKTYNLEDLRQIRLELMAWVDQFNIKNLLNGDKLLDKCIELGADKTQIDYD